jgi:hypothetical protein
VELSGVCDEIGAGVPQLTIKEVKVGVTLPLFEETIETAGLPRRFAGVISTSSNDK